VDIRLSVFIDMDYDLSKDSHVWLALLCSCSFHFLISNLYFGVVVLFISTLIPLILAYLLFSRSTGRKLKGARNTTAGLHD